MAFVGGIDLMRPGIAVDVLIDGVQALPDSQVTSDPPQTPLYEPPLGGGPPAILQVVAADLLRDLIAEPTLRLEK